MSGLRQVDNLAEILAGHKAWLADSRTGARADLRSANLHSANLHYANLHYADLELSRGTFGWWQGE